MVAFLEFKRKSQSSIEVLILLGIFLVILIIIIQSGQKSLDNYETMIEQKKADSFLNELTLASNLVYQQGFGAKTKIFVDLPETIEDINISNKTISLKFLNGDYKYRNFNYGVIGNLPVDIGNYYIELEAMNGFILILKQH